MSHDVVVGLCDPGNDPFWLQVKDAIFQKARRLPIRFIPISSGVPNDAQGAAAPLAVVEELLALELHALINWGWPEQLALPVLEAGLPLVHLSETTVRHPLAVSPVGLYDVGYLAAEYLASHLHGQGHILIVGGLCQRGLPDDGRSRLDGIDAALARYPKLNYSHAPSTWNASARAMVEAAIQALAGPPDGILALSDSLALMALDALSECGFVTHTRPVAAQIPVVGINGDPLALSAITRAEMLATVETDPYALGEQAVELAYLAARHHPLPAHYPIPRQLITSRNVASVAANRLIATAALPLHLVGELDRLAQHRQLQLQTSLAISRRIGSLLDPDALVEEVTSIIRTYYGYDRALLYRWNPEQRRLLGPAPGVVGAAAIAEPLLEPSGMFAQVLFGDEAIFIPNTRRSLRFAEDPLWPDIQARVVLPVRQGGAVVGLLDLHCTQANSQMAHEQVTELRALADQLGVAMQNAQLYRRQSELSAATETMEAVKTQFMARASRELRAALTMILEDAAQAPEAANLERIQASAADLLKLTDDLLDLAQTQMGSPARGLLDVAVMFQQVWDEWSLHNVDGLSPNTPVCRIGNLPRLPLVFADSAQLRRGFQALFDHMHRRAALETPALGAALSPVTGAAVELPFLHVWLGIDTAQSTLHEWHAPSSWGVELSLSRARRLFSLLGGALTVDSEPQGLTTFHVRLPLPTFADVPCTGEYQGAERVLVISSEGRIDALDHSRPDGVLLQDATKLDDLLWRTRPGALLWDAQFAVAADWDLLLAVRTREQLQRLPFMLYVPPAEQEDPEREDSEAAVVRGQSLAATIAACCPTTASKSVLLLGVDRATSRSYRALIARCLPGVPVIEVASAADLGEVLRQMAPALVITDLEPDLGRSLAFIEQLRSGEQAQHSPVLVLTEHPLDAALVARLTLLAPILYAGSFIFTPDELLALLARTFTTEESLPPRTSEIVKQAILFVQQHFDQPLNRSDVAEAVAVSENYLSQIFRQEMGISLWDYLNRQRIHKAKCLLRSTSQTVTEIAAAAGIYDPAYFSRIFHKQTGLSPSAYRVAAQRAVEPK